MWVCGICNEGSKIFLIKACALCIDCKFDFLYYYCHYSLKFPDLTSSTFSNNLVLITAEVWSFFLGNCDSSQFDFRFLETGWNVQSYFYTTTQFSHQKQLADQQSSQYLSANTTHFALHCKQSTDNPIHIRNMEVLITHSMAQNTKLSCYNRDTKTTQS